MSQTSDSPVHIPDHTLVRMIGRGAYGEVWLAKNVMGMWRAVKIVRRASFTSERPYEREFEGIRRFEPVSRAHDTQVDILHVGRDDSAELFYYVMELGDDVHSGQEIVPATYIPRTLESELKEKQRLPARQCIQIGLALATALEHLHAHGLIHRDIKPSNIIFVHGRPKLADIGLVATAEEAVSFVGTEGYVPVEGPGSSRADIFSLGRVLYEITTGFSQRRFPEIPTSFGLDEKDAEMARELNLIVNKACARGADSRHASAAVLREELRLLESGHSIRRLRENERRLVIARWIGAVAAVIAAFSLVGYFSAKRANARADAHLAEARAAQAKSLRAGDRAGRRPEALAAIADAAKIQPGRELRDDALAMLTATDIGEPEQVTLYPKYFSPNLRRPMRARMSADGKYCAWMLDRREVLVTETAGGRDVVHLPIQSVNGRALEWSPEGRYIAAYSQEKIVVWDWRTGRKVIDQTIEKSDAGAAAAFSADDSRVLLCLGNRMAVFDCASGQELVGVGTPDRQTAFAIHPDGNLFGFVGPGTANIWSVESKSEVLSREIPKSAGGSLSFRHVCWSKNGKLVAGVLTDGTLLMYGYDSGKVTLRVGHVGIPGNVAFSPDSRFLLTASADDGTRVWDVKGGLLRVASIPNAFGAQFTSDSEAIILTNSTGFERRKISRQPEYVTPVYAARHRMELTACSPDGRMLAAMGDKHESIDIWDVATGNKLGTLGGILAGDRELGWMSFSRDGRSLFAVGNTGFVSCGVALKDGALSLGWTTTTKLPLKCECGGAGDTSPDGKEIAVRATGAAFLVFPIAEPSKAQTVTVASGRIVGLSWSSDGGRIAVSNSQSAPLIFDAKSLAQVRTFGNGSGRLTFSPDGRFLALTTATACEILDATSYQLVKSFERHPLEGNPGEIVFAQNGTFLVLSTEGRKTELIDLTRMENVATFEPPASSRANRLDILPDGSSLILHDADSAYIYRLLPLRRKLSEMGLDW